MTRYFDDVTIGEKYDLGTHTFSGDDIVTFAERYDPLLFHTDPDAAAEMFFGGLVASGWQTGITCYAAASEQILTETSVVAGRGVEEMYFQRPVRPDETFEAQAEIVEKRPEANPKLGLVRISIEAYLREAGPETTDTSRPQVMSMDILPILARRNATKE